MNEKLNSGTPTNPRPATALESHIDGIRSNNNKTFDFIDIAQSGLLYRLQQLAKKINPEVYRIEFESPSEAVDTPNGACESKIIQERGLVDDMHDVFISQKSLVQRLFDDVDKPANKLIDFIVAHI